MMTHALKALLASVLLLQATGCSWPGRSRDPLTKYLDNHDYHAFNPPRSRAVLGDVYRTPQLEVAPIELVSNVLAKDEVNDLMARARHEVSLPIVSGESEFQLDGSAAIISGISAQLRGAGVQKYRIRVHNPHEYVLSQGEFRAVIEDAIRIRVWESLDEKHYIYSLLEVDGIEYEFLDDKGAKVDLQPDGQLTEALTASLGSGWHVTSESKLISTEPRFIGYRTHQIEEREGLSQCNAPADLPMTESGSQKSAFSALVDWILPDTTTH